MNTWKYRVVVNYGPNTYHDTLEDALQAWDIQTFNVVVHTGVVEYRELNSNLDCVRTAYAVSVADGHVTVLPTIGDLP